MDRPTNSTCPEGFLDRLDAFSQIGTTDDGGVDRVEASPANGLARRELARRMEAAGYRVLVDGIGNMFGLLELAEQFAGQEAPWVFAGSHIDSQPKGGRLDGAYGVLAALEAGQALKERLAGRPAKANLAVVAWTGEEGARFQPSLLGSSVHAGILPLEQALARKDGNGVSVADALDAIGFRGRDQAPKPSAYVELHVECAPALENSNTRLGVFDRWWGAHKLELLFTGATAHTGPTPMAKRKDALLAAAEVITGLRRLADAAPAGALHTSVGRLEVLPNSPNVVPDSAKLFIEIRSVDAKVMADTHARLMELIPYAATLARVAHRIVRDEYRAPGAFEIGLRTLAREEADHLGILPMSLETIAAHDAMPVAKLCPSVVIAVPSRDGLCHSPREWTDPRDLELGVAWLGGILERLVVDGPESV
ncbi:Zn-dependent hydrolase [Geminicoccus roseus]|uniref:Zn-dependent hydrolase n=1 Tax=Geminicoccus roseus TaxID=404900 RepID=UPI000403DA98|nr:Zn-dependent hydrolase [Geminicoccus roseus]